MEYLQHLSFWDWLAFGTVLLILEVFGAGGYLLWIGLAAAAVGRIAEIVRAAIDSKYGKPWWSTCSTCRSGTGWPSAPSC